jgi:hypothetical protein
MTHHSEDDLILYYYGEGRRRLDIERHLDGCPECSAVYRSIAGTLGLVPVPDVPERDDSYALEVWQRLRPRLPDQDGPSWRAWIGWNWVSMTASAIVIALVAFVAGRTWPQPDRPQADRTVPAGQAGEVADAAQRVRLAAIADHLERSERVLLDLVNAEGQAVDLTDQQVWAADLIDSNRLYREAATRAGDTLVANVLDELERSLLEIVHGPSQPMAAELDDVRARVDAAALLFRVRILADELHERETAPVQPRKTT